jgi:phage tail-like protein
MPTTAARTDPYSAFNFLIDIDGITLAGFSECSGLTAESDVIDYRTGDMDITVSKLPGLRKYNHLLFKHGITSSTELWQWRLTVINGQTVRKSGSITLLDEGRQRALEWTFTQAWPCKYEGPTLNGKTNEVAIETLEICHEGLVLA